MAKMKRPLTNEEIIVYMDKIIQINEIIIEAMEYTNLLQKGGVESTLKMFKNIKEISRLKQLN